MPSSFTMTLVGDSEFRQKRLSGSGACLPLARDAPQIRRTILPILLSPNTLVENCAELVLASAGVESYCV